MARETSGLTADTVFLCFLVNNGFAVVHMYGFALPAVEQTLQSSLNHFTATYILNNQAAPLWTQKNIKKLLEQLLEGFCTSKMRWPDVERWLPIKSVPQVNCASIQPSYNLQTYFRQLNLSSPAKKWTLKDGFFYYHYLFHELERCRIAAPLVGTIHIDLPNKGWLWRLKQLNSALCSCSVWCSSGVLTCKITNQVSLALNFLTNNLESLFCSEMNVPR